MTPQDLLTVPSGTDALAAAKDLAMRLEAAGHTPHVMEMIHKMSGLAMVHVHHEGADDEVVLVHTGDEASLREAVMQFQQLPTQGAQWRLATAGTAPADVAAIFDGGDGSRLSHRLASTDALPLTMPLSAAPQAAESVVALVEQTLDVKLDLDGGKQTLATIDGLVDRMRPAGTLPEEAVTPFHAMMGLGLVATETARRMGPASHLGRMDESFHEAKNLAEAFGFPAVAFSTGMALQVARKVPQRYVMGSSESLVALWDAAKLPAPLPKDEQEAIAVALDGALGLAGSLVHFVAGEIRDEGQPSGPLAWSLEEGGITFIRLMAEDGNRALEMFKATFEKKPEVEAMAFVADAYATNPNTGVKRDALMVAVASKGVQYATLMVPYVVADGAVSFPDQAQWIDGPKLFEYSMERATKAFGPGAASYGLTEVRNDYLTGVQQASQRPWNAADAAEAAGVVGADGDALLMKLASLAPFALFMGVAMADGEVDDSEMNTFAAGLFDNEKTHPLLQEMVGATDLLPNQRFKMVISQEGMGGRAIAAAGAIFAKHPQGAEGRAAFEALGQAIASADGVVTDDETAVLEGLLQALDLGEDFALLGGDPFVEGVDANLFGDLPDEVVAIASFAPFAAFMMVAGADGNLDPREAVTFLARITTEEDPVLRALLDMGDMPLDQRMGHLADNRDLIKASLMAAMVVFMQVPGGSNARNALMSILEAIAGADGHVDAGEQAALDNLGKLFDGRLQQQRASVPWIPILIVGGLVVAAVIWAIS